MLRRSFLKTASAFLVATAAPPSRGELIAQAARKQIGVTAGYDPKYARIPYPNGDVARSTGVCCDVIVRAGRDALSLDLQKLVHEDMAKDFAAYPKTRSMQHPDANIDHRRVPNLETFWRRAGCELWHSPGAALGNGFPGPLAVGDILTWRLDARWPHVGMVVEESLFRTRVVHNWGNGAEESALLTFAPHRAIGHYRWPTA
jgi:uncharacterized protein